MNDLTITTANTMTTAELSAELVKLGKASVTTARVDLALLVIKAAFQGAVLEKSDPKVSPGIPGVKEVYMEYLASREKQLNKSSLSAGDMGTVNGIAANVSKLRQMCKMGALIGPSDPCHTADRAILARKALLGTTDDKIKAPFELLADIARAQIANPDTDLTDDQIDACLRQPEKDDKSELERLVSAYKATVKLDQEYALAGTAAAVQGLADAITEKGGELPPITKDEVKAAKAIKAAEALGFVVTR